MGEIADDIANGNQCSRCGVMFGCPVPKELATLKNEVKLACPGYPVLCSDCSKEDKGRSGIPRSLEPEL